MIWSSPPVAAVGTLVICNPSGFACRLHKKAQPLSTSVYKFQFQRLSIEFVWPKDRVMDCPKVTTSCISSIEPLYDKIFHKGVKNIWFFFFPLPHMVSTKHLQLTQFSAVVITPQLMFFGLPQFLEPWRFHSSAILGIGPLCQ